jgi:hypothetical protein
MKQWESVEQLQRENKQHKQLIYWLIEKMGGSIEVPYNFDQVEFEYNVEVADNSFILSSRKTGNE